LKKKRVLALTAVAAMVVGVVVAIGGSSGAIKARANSAGGLRVNGNPTAHWCNTNGITCTEPYQNWQNFSWYNHVTQDEHVKLNEYIGHDEPSVLFYSNKAGSGNNNTYNLMLPTDPPVAPRQDQSGGSYNFQLHPAFWIGMAMCDDQSAPNPSFSGLSGPGPHSNTYPNNPCTKDSDSNIYTSQNGSNANYVGKHPGMAFMEMQFYPPGWVKWPNGVSCDATRWCAALNIDSLSENMNDGVVNNADCLNSAGLEPVNFAYLTKSGNATAPASPLNFGNASVLHPAKDYFMKSGDKLRLHMFDTSAGFKVVVSDLTNGTTGSMTASVANGFGSVNFDPGASTCSVTKHAFHPAYSTSSPDTSTVWAAHSYNIAYSDEIGHFEYCSKPVNDLASGTPPFGVPILPCDNSANSGFATNNTFPFSTGYSGDLLDMNFCLPIPGVKSTNSSAINVKGCEGIFIDSDVDFDGVSYDARSWPGSMANQTLNHLLAPSPIRFTTPTTVGGTPLGQVAFETDLSRIEDNRPDGPFGGMNQSCQRIQSATGGSLPADTNPGMGCFNPPPQSRFYPFYTTVKMAGQCWWQEGGSHIPGTIDTFGGEKAEYGSLLPTFYPEDPAGTNSVRLNNFHRTLTGNPCK